jgi:hypothetical protein
MYLDQEVSLFIKDHLFHCAMIQIEKMRILTAKLIIEIERSIQLSQNNHYYLIIS